VSVKLLPPESSAVIVYVVVTAGETLSDPLRFTEPMPWSILTETALVDVQERVVDKPGMMFVCEAAISTVSGMFTVTVALSVVVLPPGPVAVIV